MKNQPPRELIAKYMDAPKSWKSTGGYIVAKKRPTTVNKENNNQTTAILPRGQMIARKTHFKISMKSSKPRSSFPSFEVVDEAA